MSETLLKPGWISRVVHANGIGIHLVEAGPREGRPLILLHGFPEFWWAWRRMIDPLAEAGFRVIAPDLRGYNRTDAPEGVDAYQLDVLVNDVLGLADALGVQRFDLVGHDWGGVIAWRMATRSSTRLNRIVVMDAPHPAVWLRQSLRHPTQAFRSSYALFFQLPLGPEAALKAFDHAAARALLIASSRPGVFSEAELEHYARSWSRPRRMTAMLNYYRALVRRPPDETSGRIAPETLLLWGDKDVALELHLADASLEQCDRGRLQVIPNASHWLHLEEPVRIAEEIAGFLRP
jgi:pimeloyl-ACP methyl ester carboxylesterase